jgi:DNA-binding response OmpR family regulator
MGFIDNIKVLAGQKKFPEKPRPTTHLLTPKKVLIVEDEKPLADTLETEFENAGFAVIKAENGQVGLDLVKSEKPGLVILDLLMPVMDGKIMLRRMREIPQFRHTPVIVLTNAGEIENIRETQTYSGAEEFLIKSNVSMEEIIVKAKNLMGVVQVIKPTE